MAWPLIHRQGNAALPDGRTTHEHRDDDRTLNPRSTTEALRRERAICDIRIAVDNGRHPTAYLDVTAFDAHGCTCACACAKYLSKSRLAVLRRNADARGAARSW